MNSVRLHPGHAVGADGGRGPGSSTSSHYAPDARDMNVALPCHDAVTVGFRPRCEPSRAGRAATLAEAARQGRTVEFLTLHRLLTDVVRVRATAADVDFMIALRA